MDAIKNTFVLNVGKEQTYLELRHQLLADAEYEVTSVNTVEEAKAASTGKGIDVLVVGAWVPKAERNQLVRQAKASNPRAIMIFYYDQNIDDTEEADAILNFRGDHSDLVRTVQHLLAKANKDDSGGSKGGKLRHMAGMMVAALSNPFFWTALATA